MADSEFIIPRDQWNLIKTSNEFAEANPKYAERLGEGSAFNPNVVVTTSDDRLKDIIRNNSTEIVFEKIPPKLYKISSSFSTDELRAELEKKGFKEGRDFEITTRWFRMNEVTSSNPKVQEMLNNNLNLYPQQQARLEPQDKKGKKEAIA